MVQGQTPGLPQSRKPESELKGNVPESSIREELTRVLSGHEFRSSKRSQDFLRYVVEHTLDGHSETLKERTIGIEVFGRPVSYDPSEDATVRVKAGEVRKRLGMYYAAEGLHNPVRIELPAGTYIPEFRVNGAANLEAVAIPSVVPLLRPSAAASHRWLATFCILGVILLFGAGLWIWSRSGAPLTPLDQFWAPVLQGSAPVSVCAAYVPLLGRDPNSTQGFTLFTDQFVGGGDLIAVSRLSALLTRRQRAYHVRIGNEISLHDLEVAPAIMVGYSLTHWKEISSELRYFIDASRTPVGITDHGAPTQWTLLNLPADRHTTEDYAIVSRVFHPDTHAMLVELAGITQYGTDAASDLVTTPDLMADALRGAPPDWPKKNMQLVLHVKVISGAPSSPRVVATYFW
ncbi:MAG: hypothetical protein ABSH09_20610 [Bryobacteraceae bacterium]|jgi:hypothetical protein